MSQPENYHFNLEDPTWIEHLNSFGYVVVKDVASSEDIARASEYLHRDLKSLKIPKNGLVASLAQSEGAWSVRGLTDVKKVFNKIWETDDLIVSMDAIIAWKKWKGYDESANNFEDSPPPRTGGLHLDQNPFDKPDLDCIQGMMPLLPVTQETGGLELVPKSHLEENKIPFRERYPSMKGQGDWCPLNKDDPLYQDAILVLAEPGDLILWDSRTIHGGRVGTGKNDQNGHEKENDHKPINASINDSKSHNIQDQDRAQSDVPLVRLSVTVAMTPRSMASTEALKARIEGFNSGTSFSHCPHADGTGLNYGQKKLPAEVNLPILDESQRSLL